MKIISCRTIRLSVLFLLLCLLVAGMGPVSKAVAQDGGPTLPPPTPVVTVTPPPGLEAQKKELERQSPEISIGLLSPSNDDFDNAEFVASNPYTNVQDTIGATVASDDPTMGCGTGINSNTVWYRLSVDANGTLTADTFGSSYDTVLSAFTGSRGNLTPVICNDDSSSIQSKIEFPIQAGVVYYLEAADYGGPGGGTLNLNVVFTPPPQVNYNTLYASANTDLWALDPYTGTGTRIGSIGYQGTDIAFDGKLLYGISFSQLLAVDPSTGAGSVIGEIGYGDVNALTVAPDGTMYAGTVSGKLLQIDKTSGAGTLIGNYGPSIGSSGDLAIRYDNKMYASVTRSGYSTDWLVLVDLNTGRATPIGNIGEWGVYGLDFKDWNLYGVTSNGYLIQIDPTTGRSTRIKTFSADFWGLSTSGPALSGSITAPKDGYSTGPASLSINASAQYFGGRSLDQVEFYVAYGGIWRSLGNDTTSPYLGGWEIPPDLVSQQALLRIDVVGTDTQNHVQRASYAGGVRRINYIQSLNNPSIVENWVPVRAYLSQRSLSPDGDSKCNVSSIAMVLAMDGYIYPDYLTMANKANELWPYMQPVPNVAGECSALKSVVSTAYCSGVKNQTDAWQIVKSSIDNGHPIIVDSRPGAVTRDGHYSVAVGYKEVSGKHYMITYDPFGEWKGLLNQYYGNRLNDPASHVGKWVYYEFEKFTASDVYLFATVDPSSAAPASSEAISSDAIQLTPPDQISNETRVSVIFTGSGIIPTFADVPVTHTYYQDIEILYANGLTGGCQVSPPKFCPEMIMNRGQAAAFMLRANFGPSYVPPTPTHIFKDDWTKGPWAEPWAEGMKAEGFSAGCLTNPPKYCPWTQIPREQAVIFILKMKYGKDYMPPPATGTVFADMTNPGFYATAWAEQAYKEGLIPNCGLSGGKPKICPKELVARGLAAHMIVNAKNLTMP